MCSSNSDSKGGLITYITYDKIGDRRVDQTGPAGDSIWQETVVGFLGVPSQGTCWRSPPPLPPQTPIHIYVRETACQRQRQVFIRS